jgi:hypothetical protein
MPAGSTPLNVFCCNVFCYNVFCCKQLFQTQLLTPGSETTVRHPFCGARMVGFYSDWLLPRADACCSRPRGPASSTETPT